MNENSNTDGSAKKKNCHRRRSGTIKYMMLLRCSDRAAKVGADVFADVIVLTS